MKNLTSNGDSFASSMGKDGWPLPWTWTTLGVDGLPHRMKGFAIPVPTVGVMSEERNVNVELHVFDIERNW